MSQLLSLVILHPVFSPKRRFPFLRGGIGPRAHAHPATLCRDLGSECYALGGTEHRPFRARLAGWAPKPGAARFALAPGSRMKPRLRRSTAGL
jgi:hypothetical protein